MVRELKDGEIVKAFGEVKVVVREFVRKFVKKVKVKKGGDGDEGVEAKQDPGPEGEGNDDKSKETGTKRENEALSHEQLL